MSHKPFKELDEGTLQKIVAVAYGDARLRDRWYIFRLAKRYPELRQQLEAYRQTAQSVHKINLVSCPHPIIEGIKSKTDYLDWEHEEQKDKSWQPFSKLGVQLGIIALFLFILYANFLKQPLPEPAYIDAEILAAEVQVKQSLVMVSRHFREIDHTLKDDILFNVLDNHLIKVPNSLSPC